MALHGTVWTATSSGRPPQCGVVSSPPCTPTDTPAQTHTHREREREGTTLSGRHWLAVMRVATTPPRRWRRWTALSGAATSSPVSSPHTPAQTDREREREQRKATRSQQTYDSFTHDHQPITLTDQTVRHLPCCDLLQSAVGDALVRTLVEEGLQQLVGVADHLDGLLGRVGQQHHRPGRRSNPVVVVRMGSARR